ncbi:MAG: glycosyltransferase family 39 protein [Acidobacteria bacterium]|nr:MAG: glycosyltransferase family 39 protein [Acidobacteriota bacterium]
MKPARSFSGDDLLAPRAVLLFALLFCGWNLWGYDLWAPDEPYFGEGAREMIADGRWLVPHVNGEVTTDKPPLFFWTIALFSLPLGQVTSLTARLPSLLAALFTLWLTMRLGARFAGRRTGALAGYLLATTYIFWDKARSAQIDSLLTCLILVALYAFVRFRAGELEGRRAGLIFWGAAALAVLAKGPVGLLLPLGIALLTLAADRRLRRWRSFAPLAGPLLFVLVAGAWAAAASRWGGDYSVAGALREHFVDRAMHGMHHEQPPWYYLKVLPYALMPWSLLLPGALLLAWRRRRQPEDRYLLIHALFVVVFFSLSAEKRDLYILPAVPAFALLNARLVAAVAGWWPAAAPAAIPGRRWVSVPQGVIGALMVLLGVAAPIAAPRFSDDLLVPAAALAAVLSAGGVLILALALRGRALAAVRWSAVTMAAAGLLAVTFVFPALDPIKSGRQLAVVVRDETAPARAAGRPVFGLDLGNVVRWVNFYSDGIYLKELASPQELVRAAAAGPVYLVADEASLASFPRQLRQRMTMVYSSRLSRKDVVLMRYDG